VIAPCQFRAALSSSPPSCSNGHSLTGRVPEQRTANSEQQEGAPRCPADRGLRLTFPVRTSSSYTTPNTISTIFTPILRHANTCHSPPTFLSTTIVSWLLSRLPLDRRPQEPRGRNTRSFKFTTAASHNPLLTPSHTLPTPYLTTLHRSLELRGYLHRQPRLPGSCVADPVNCRPFRCLSSSSLLHCHHPKRFRPARRLRSYASGRPSSQHSSSLPRPSCASTMSFLSRLIPA
jgi:hypothetical protein